MIIDIDAHFWVCLCWIGLCSLVFVSYFIFSDLVGSPCQSVHGFWTSGSELGLWWSWTSLPRLGLGTVMKRAMGTGNTERFVEGHWWASCLRLWCWCGLWSCTESWLELPIYFSGLLGLDKFFLLVWCSDCCGLHLFFCLVWHAPGQQNSNWVGTRGTSRRGEHWAGG